MSIIGNTLLSEYEKKYPREKHNIDLCRAFLNSPDSLAEEYAAGHITGSAWILNASRDKAVLTHHRKLDLWLQTGGHLEEGEDPREGAIREAYEETGLTSLRFIGEWLFDLDIHLIPPRGGRPAHYHFDMRFLLESGGEETLVISEESRDLRWVSLEEIPLYSRSDSVWRLALKSSAYAVSPVFGLLEPDVSYDERIGVYGILRDERGRVALIETPRGYFLPGGRWESGESAEECLVREIGEEMGWAAETGKFLGRSVLFGFAPRCGRHMKMVGLYYEAVYAGEGRKCEKDHETVWFHPGEAAGKLKLDHQAWAVGKLSPRGI